jgi:hypothetical protein
VGDATIEAHPDVATATVLAEEPQHLSKNVKKFFQTELRLDLKKR